jgi:hypothetical protein
MKPALWKSRGFVVPVLFALAAVFIVIGFLAAIYWRNLKDLSRSMYLLLAIFWLIVGVFMQIYWDVLQPWANIPVDRVILGVILFVLFSYNFFRWRLSVMSERTVTDQSEPTPRPRVEREYNPELDFTDDKKEPPA